MIQPLFLREAAFIFRKKAYNQTMKFWAQKILGGLVVCAMLIAAAIPAGFMPNIARAAAPDGTLYPLVLCTAYGEKTVFVPAAQSPEAPAQKHSPDTPAHDEAAHTPCPYAPVLAQGAPLPAALPVPFIFDAGARSFGADSAARATFLDKNWQSQAPPFA